MSQSSQNDRSWSKWHMRLHKRLKQNKSLLPNNSTLLLAVSGGQDSMALLKLITDLKIPKTLSEVGIKHNDIPQLAEDAMKQERLLINNPRELNLSDAKSIYEAAL